MPNPPWEMIASLPAVDSGRIQAEQIDANGHLTVTQYFGLLSSATLSACGEFELDLRYPVAQGMGLFSVDHHARYIGEMMLGARYSTHARLLNASETAVHMMAYLVDLDQQRLSSTLETLLLNVSLTTRAVTRFSGDTIATLSAALGRAQALPWDETGCKSVRMPGRVLSL
jgi:acyl-CoA thioester hydrolase